MGPRTKLHFSLRVARTAAVLLAAGLAASLPMALTACGEASAANPGGQIELASAQIRDFEIVTLASGDLAAKNRVELRSQVERQTNIVEIAPEGTRAKAGDVLVRLNSDEIEREIEEEEIQLTEAKLDLEAAETAYQIQLSDNESALRKAELAVRLADLALKQWEEGDVVKKRQELQTAIEKAERDYERLDKKVKKSRELFERNFLSSDELEQDEIATLEAQAKLETARIDERVYEEFQYIRDREQKQSDLTEALQELKRVEQANEINLKNKASQRENRAVQLNRRKERLDDYRRQLEACTLVAPTDGLVVYGTTAQRDGWRSQSEGPLAVGQVVRNNDLLIVLPDTSEMVANVKVHESLAGRIRAGQRTNVKVPAAGGLVVPGEVESIGVLAETGGWRDPNRREYTVRVLLDPGTAANELKPSMRCEAEIVLGEVEQALAVPVQSVFSDGPVRYVLVPEGNRYARRPVDMGRRSDLYAEIRGGLAKGERVLLRSPEAGEVIDRPWDEQELAEAGYSTDERGQPVAMNRRGPGGGAPRGERPGASG